MSTHWPFSAHKGATKERTYLLKKCADDPSLQCCLLSFVALYEPSFRFFFILSRTYNDTSMLACYLSLQNIVSGVGALWICGSCSYFPQVIKKHQQGRDLHRQLFLNS